MGYYWTPSLASVWAERLGVEAADIRGRPLRYLLFTLLQDAHGPLTVQELAEGCSSEGVTFSGRASKIISDALRWEVRNGRVRRLSRGVYTVGRVPDSTRRWIGHRVRQTRIWLAWVHRNWQAKLEVSSDYPLWWEWQDVSWVPGWPGWPAPPPGTLQTRVLSSP